MSVGKRCSETVGPPVLGDASVPADGFLGDCPVKVRERPLAVLDPVGQVPAPQFSGCWRWEAEHGDMGGYQVRLFAVPDPAKLAQVLPEARAVGSRTYVAEVSPVRQSPLSPGCANPG